MRTLGSVRAFEDRPVPQQIIRRVFDNARFAGSGGNRQGWHVVVLESPAVRAEIARLSDIGFREYYAQAAAGFVPFAPGDDGRWHGTPIDLVAARANAVENPFASVIQHAPVLLLVTVDLRTLAVTDIDADHLSIVGGASVYPFVHNLLLAARNEGLAGVLTTFVCRAESAVRTLVRLPDSHSVAALIPLGFPVHQPTKLRRKAVAEIVTIDHFDGPAFTDHLPTDDQ